MILNIIYIVGLALVWMATIGLCAYALWITLSFLAAAFPALAVVVLLVVIGGSMLGGLAAASSRKL